MALRGTRLVTSSSAGGLQKLHHDHTGECSSLGTLVLVCHNRIFSPLLYANLSLFCSLYIYIYVYTCIYIYMYVYIYICMYIYIYIYLFIYLLICLFIWLFIYMHMLSNSAFPVLARSRPSSANENPLISQVFCPQRHGSKSASALAALSIFLV